MNSALHDVNQRTVERFLAGTHSPSIEDVNVIDETVLPEISCHGFLGMSITDRHSYKEFFRTFRQAFTDVDFNLEAQVADDNYVAARWSIAATHCGLFCGIAGEGRRVSFDGMVLYRMQNGLIAETWLHLNELSLLSQIGALPSTHDRSDNTVAAEGPSDGPETRTRTRSSAKGGVARARRKGTFHIDVPPEAAFDLFTAEGERLWVPGWEPELLFSGRQATGDVFVTESTGVTIWTVISSDRENWRNCYSRVTPGQHAGIVEVTLAPEAGGSQVHVSYNMTALPGAPADALNAYREEEFRIMLERWRELILDALSRQRL